MLTGGNQWLVEYQKILCLQKRRTHIYSKYIRVPHMCFFPIIFPVFFLPSSQVLPLFLNKQKNPPHPNFNPPNGIQVEIQSSEFPVFTQQPRCHDGGIHASGHLCHLLHVLPVGMEVFFCWKKWADHVYICIYYIEKVRKIKDSRIDDIENLLLKTMNGILWKTNLQLMAV